MCLKFWGQRHEAQKHAEVEHGMGFKGKLAFSIVGCQACLFKCLQDRLKNLRGKLPQPRDSRRGFLVFFDTASASASHGDQIAPMHVSVLLADAMLGSVAATPCAKQAYCSLVAASVA